MIKITHFHDARQYSACQWSLFLWCNKTLITTKYIDMKPFSLGLVGLILRFYAMMAVVLIGGFSGQFWIMLFALPIFLSGMMGIKFGGQKEETVSMKRTLKQNESAAQAA